MSKPNKYHSSGRLYTNEEQEARKGTKNYIHAHRMAANLWEPYEQGRNVAKLVAKIQGFKSLKQKIRSQK